MGREFKRLPQPRRDMRCYAAMALVQENLETANESVRWEIAGQIANASAIDAKAIGLLAFMGALAAVLLTIPNGLASTRWLLLLGSVGSSAVVLIGIVAAEDLKSGPENRRLLR